ncbi:energy transducer TonB [Marinicauda salina]|nr:energy transducer TonB [Marinicauda salina]
MRRLAVTALTLVLAACAGDAALNPLPDPRERGPFRVTSDMPLPPNVERTASGEGCRGGELRAASASLPDYPARGWARGLQGWSIVEFDVLASGAVENVRIAEGVPGGSFDREALRAVRDWRFQPLDEGAHLTGCVVMFEFKMGNVTIR